MTLKKRGDKLKIRLKENKKLVNSEYLVMEMPFYSQNLS